MFEKAFYTFILFSIFHNENDKKSNNDFKDSINQTDSFGFIMKDKKNRFH